MANRRTSLNGGVCACVSKTASGRHLFIHGAFWQLPAEAHHPGGGGNTGSGGAINTISADTLSEGLIAASVRYEFIRLGKLSDADLLAAAANGTHAHSLRSIDAISISAAYGITNDSPSRFAPAACAAPISASPARTC